MDEFDEWGEDDQRGRSGLEREDVRATFCRKVAERTLAKFRVAEPPVPIDRLAVKAGFSVRIVQLPNGVDARLRTVGNERSIELSTGQARVRQRFSIAHELGHHLLGHRHGESDLAERQANIFAGAILVPSSWLRRDLAVYPTADALAARYEVSRDVIFIAAKDARVLKRLR